MLPGYRLSPGLSQLDIAVQCDYQALSQAGIRSDNRPTGPVTKGHGVEEEKETSEGERDK
eukprot:710874-Hanusia_phi.AAC.1